MGIKGYFRKLIEKNEDSHTNKIENVDNFLLDFNSMIYNAYYSTKNKTEDETIKMVIDELKEVIKLVNPSKTLIIAMDGTVPMAKAVTSRRRRYKAHLQKQLYKDFGYNKTVMPLDTSEFTPGTKFMDNLSDTIKSYLKTIKLKIKIIFSDANEPGEGEHKIMPFLRELSNKKSNKNTVIMSPDADMIILSLISNAPNVKIMRLISQTEQLKKFYSETDKYIFFDVDKLGKSYIDTILDFGECNISKINLYYDYALCVSFTGNDFIPAIKYLQMSGEMDFFGTGKRISSLDMIITIYKNILKQLKEPLTVLTSSGISINRTFLIHMLKDISTIELQSLKNIQKKKDMNRKIMGFTERDKLSFEGKNDEEIFSIIFDNFEFTRPKHPLHSKYNKEFDKINYYNDNWEEQYYKINLNIKDPKEVLTFKNKICHQYLMSMQFVLNYYTIGKLDTQWYNPFMISPLITTLYNYILNETKDNNLNFDKEFNTKNPFFKPVEQLLIVIPPSLHHCLPTKYAKFMTDINSPIIDYFPHSFELDVINGYKWIYSEPILPNIDLQRFLTAIKD